MSRDAAQRWIFLFSSFVVLVFSASYVPTIYGNDLASIERYLAVHEGRRLGDHVEILAVEDVGADRFVVFRRETKRPEDVMVFRFRQNEAGDYTPYQYEGYLPGMDSRPAHTIYWSWLGGSSRDDTIYLVVWSQEDDLAQIQGMTVAGPEQQYQAAAVLENPSLTVLSFSGISGEGLRHVAYDVTFWDNAGEEI